MNETNNEAKAIGQFDEYLPFENFDEVVTYLASIEKIDLAAPKIHGTEAYDTFALKIINCVTRMRDLKLSDEQIYTFIDLYHEKISDRNGNYDHDKILNNNQMSSFRTFISPKFAQKIGLADYAIDLVNSLTVRNKDGFRKKLSLLTENSYCNKLLNDWYYARKFGPDFEAIRDKESFGESYKKMIYARVNGPKAPVKKTALDF